MTGLLPHSQITCRCRFPVRGGSLLLGLLLLMTVGAEAGNREQALRMHDRIAGVPPSPAVLTDMVNLLGTGQAVDAALLATDDPAFYNVTLKNLVTPWTNEEGTVFAKLNDYTATVIGMVRDDKDFRQILIGDILYVGTGVPAYSVSNNLHYETLDDQGADLKSVLTETQQSTVTGLDSNATAGVLTTRAAAKAFLIAGTNRAMLRFTFVNHLCTDLEPLKDTLRPSDRVRQDVSRSPGGDSRIFMNNCVGCHAGLDPLTQAFAYYDYAYDPNGDPDGNNGQLSFTDNVVQAKYLINDTNFKHGFITENDRWDNYWRIGQNANLQWSPVLNGFGNGPKSLGEELANSEAFARCQVRKVFRAVCLRDPEAADTTAFDQMVSSFKSVGYKLRQPFAESAAYCKGD